MTDFQQLTRALARPATHRSTSSSANVYPATGAQSMAGICLPPVAAREKHPTLTTREREIALLIAQGMKNREIAAKLVLSERTVHAHVRSILSKLDAQSRIEVAEHFRK